MDAVTIPYCGIAPSPAEWLGRWNLDPWLLAALAAALAYALTRASRAESVRLVAAVGVLALAFVSPLCALGSALFTARTVHHLLLIGLAAPLIAWGTRRARQSALPAAAATHLAVLWAWHAPAAYDAALSNTALYWLMQLSLLASATWFWRQARRAPPPAATAGLLAVMVGMGLLGGLLTFAPAPLYAAHAIGPSLWGSTPLGDQQLAGLVMWAPGSAIYLIAALVVLGRFIGPSIRARAA